MCTCAIIYTFKKIFLCATTHVDGLLALLPALCEGVGDLPDGPEEVLAREGPQLLDLLGGKDRYSSSLSKLVSL